ARLHVEHGDLRRVLAAHNPHAMCARFDLDGEGRDTAHLAVDPNWISAPRLEAGVAQESAAHGHAPGLGRRPSVPDKLRALALEHLHFLRARVQARTSESDEM